MSFTAFLIIAACVVAGYWIVSSVMEPGEDLPDLERKPEQRQTPVTNTTPAARPAPMTRPASSARPAPIMRPASSARPAPPTRPASPTRPAPAPRAFPPTARNTPALRSTTAARPAQPGSGGRPSPGRTSSAALRDWHIVLDLPQDAPRSEILAAVKRRVAQAQASGDTEAIARITQAGASALRKR